jgi:hypothetical protein
MRMVQKKKEMSTANPLTLHTLLIASQASAGGDAGIFPGLLFYWKGEQGLVDWSSQGFQVY